MTSEGPYLKGVNPALLIDKIIRAKIYACAYYKESCFALNAKTIIDKAVELKSIGGTFGGSRKPTPFLCLLLKLLQINPDKEIIRKYIEQEDYKYLRALGCFYIRLTGKPKEIYETIEPIYNDYRKILLRNSDSSLMVSHMDELVEDLLHKEIMFDLALPHLPKRHVLEDQMILSPRVSALDGTLQFEETQIEENEEDRDRKRNLKKKGRLGEGGQNPQKEPVPESIEYWNNIRQQMGLPPLKAPK